MQFKYTARDQQGKRVSAVMEAESVAAVVTGLKTAKMLPLKVIEVKTNGNHVNGASLLPKQRGTRGKVKGRELAVFSRQLAATLDAGLMLSQAIGTVGEELENKYLQAVLRNIEKDIKSGASFSKALSKYPDVFPGAYRAIVEAGEATGGLAHVMLKIATFLEHYEYLREKVKSAISYPVFLLGFSIIVITFVMLFVIPKFQEMFATSKIQLPFLTRIVIGMSDFTVRFFPFFTIVTILLVFASKILVRNQKIKFLFHAWVLRIPFIGTKIIHKFLISRFCSTLSTLMSGGVGVSSSFSITGRVINNLVLQRAIEGVRKNVIAGSSISAAVKAQSVFPSLVAKMVSVGEKTGRIDDMLRRTADYYDNELENTIARMSTLIEPVLIICVGVFIGFTVAALYLPIFNMVRLIT